MVAFLSVFLPLALRTGPMPLMEESSIECSKRSRSVSDPAEICPAKITSVSQDQTTLPLSLFELSALFPKQGVEAPVIARLGQGRLLRAAAGLTPSGCGSR
jgi:hypothetical protein